MIFKIPFTLSSLDKLKIRSKPFSSFAKSRNKFFLFEILEKLDISITPEEYISICIRSFLISFLAFFVVSSTVLVFLNV
ncbi:MAG: hypothetical protein NT076_02930, partial [Candidatus Pacearchaeota archaeon]|nr:hypothetical protein [Candidatus Pacearchaeota archaeon]